MAERCRAINPQIDGRGRGAASSRRPTWTRLLDRGFDLVLDACDSFRTKVEMIAWCRRRKLPLIVVGSAGGRTDATQVRVRDLSRTEHDAMLALVRKKLRSEFNFPKNTDRYFGISAIYSLENVQAIRRPMAASAACGRRWRPMRRSSSIAAPGWARPRTSPARSRSPRWARRWNCC